MDYSGTFGLKEPFDVAFFSYSLSMIPTWSAAISTCLGNLKSGGRMYVVDFWDQAGYNPLFRTMLKVWLAMFHVHFRPELLAHLEELHNSGLGELTIEPVYKRYAYIAKFVKY
jgi:S-adenosylmethionine-diacylgycerolhomoserine-N-methlytransferase